MSRSILTEPLAGTTRERIWTVAEEHRFGQPRIARPVEVNAVRFATRPPLESDDNLRLHRYPKLFGKLQIVLR